jgi:uncharacterized protein (AIM24 family)
MSAPPPPPVHLPGQQAARAYICAWCGAQGSGTDLTCRACGATIDVKAVVSNSGWVELPAIKDMAKLQFGRSSCQIEGMYVPVAEMNLDAQDGVYFTHHVLLWMDPNIRLGTLPLRGGWKRLRAGLPLIMAQAHGPGHIAFSDDRPGELVALPLQPGQAVDVREHVFMVATGQLGYDWFATNIWFNTGTGNDKETHYPLGQYMDRFVAGQQPGLLLIHGGGNIFVRRLAPGESILIKPSSLLFKDPTVSMQLHIEQSASMSGNWFSVKPRHLWLHLRGPGRVAVESAYGFFHDPGHNITGNSAASWQRW